MREKKNNMKIVIRGKYVWAALLLTMVSCFPEHKKISFEVENLKVRYCNSDERIERINISVRPLNSDERFEWIETITLVKGNQGKNHVYLMKPNQEYEGYLRKVKANCEYMVNLPFSDISSFFVFETDENAKIIKIHNDFNCE